MALALALTNAWDARSVSADSVSCGINEITFTTRGVNTSPAINSDGTRIAFQSTRDLTGDNADGNSEIFLYDTTANSFTQITHTTLGLQGNVIPAISGDGTRIAFSSDRDLTGGNADANVELFLFDTTTNSFTQVTNTTGISVGNAFPAINNDGTRIAFQFAFDLTGANPDGNQEIFLFDTTTNSISQITNTITPGQFVGAQEPAINGDGTRIAFTTNQDLTGANRDKNLELFLFDTQSNSFTQVTSTTGSDIFNRQPEISSDGKHIAFTSNGFPGGNPDGNDELFLFDSVTGGIAQITFTSGFGSNSFSAINSDGTRIVFESIHDLTGGNADGNSEVFLFDTQTNSLTQVTSTTGQFVGAQSPTITDDGTRIAFTSNGFANVGNADGNTEIFLAACLFPPPPPPATFADLLISQSADKSAVKRGDMLTYTVTVNNFGPDSAIGSVINDTLSSGVTFVSAHANKGSFAAPPVGQTGAVTWNLGNLQNGEQEAAQIQVTVIIRGKSTITNTATASSSTTDPNPGNNSSSLMTTVQPGGKK